MQIDLHRRRPSILIASRKVSSDDSKNNSRFVKRWFTTRQYRQRKIDGTTVKLLVSARMVRTFEKTWPFRGERTTRDKSFVRLSSSGAPSRHANDSLSRSTVLIGTIQPTPRKKVVRGIASDGLEYRPRVERVSNGRCSQQHSIPLLNILYKSARNKTRSAANVPLWFVPTRIDLDLVGNCQVDRGVFYEANVAR